MLLDKGATFNALEREYSKALHAASYKEHLKVVQLLLKIDPVEINLKEH